jgi:hypothetical protein
MYRIYDKLRDEFLPIAKDETALSVIVLMRTYGEIKAKSRHEVAKLDAIAPDGKVLASFSSVNW